MAITAESFENPPPKSLDPEAAARVSKVTSKRDRQRRESVATLPEEQVSSQEKPEVIEAAKRSQSVATAEELQRARQTATQRTTLRERARNIIERERTKRREAQEKTRSFLTEAQEKAFQKSVKAKTPSEKIKAQATGAAAGFGSAAFETVVALQPRTI